jgi:Dolichyl-phosphate-mannose-protein mannosyltransferase
MRGAALAVLIVAVVVVAVRWNSWVAGGSDSYCYVHQAERWATALRDLASGRRPALQVADPLALDAPWPDAGRAFAPAGHLSSPTVPGAIVPVCPAGLSIAMAPLVAVGGPRAAFLVLPLFGALLVAATYQVGSRFGGHVGLASAILIATSPVFLYQLVQPMSDVPAAALWLLAVAAATETGASATMRSGVMASAAIVMRPNLVPLGVAIGVFLLCRPERAWRSRLRAAATYALCCAIGCIVVALIQWRFYGSPLASGYGSLSAFFAVEHIGPNARRYGEWLWRTQTPAIAAAVLAPWLLPGALVALLLALCAINITLYLPYVVFDDWSFLRFLLPTLPMMLILMVASFDAILGRMRVPLRRAVVLIGVLVMTIPAVSEAQARSTFRLQRLEARFERAGTYVGRRLPERAIVITSWQSGSVRFYGRRKTLVWDQLPPDSLEQALAYVRQRGYEPFLLFERWEEHVFRERFGGRGVAALDWPPAAEIAGQVRIYRPEDRARYLQGFAAPTEYVP